MPIKLKELIILVIVAIVLAICIAFTWQKRHVRAPISINTANQAINQNTVSNTTTTNNQDVCPASPVVKQTEVTPQGDKLVSEYWVPINCDDTGEFLIFKRQGDTGQEEWGGTFDVSYHSNDRPEKYLFTYTGLLIDIAGGGLWQVTETSDIIKMHLAFGDMGALNIWDYYISRSEQKLLLGLSNHLNIQSGTGSYELKLDTTPERCQSQTGKTITKLIIANNGAQEELSQKISTPCNGNELNIQPLIKVVGVDIAKKQVTLNIENDFSVKIDDITFNYGSGEFEK